MFIAGLEVPNSVILAPMAGVTDYPYRQIARDMGCNLNFTEMVSSKGLVYENSRTEELVDFNCDHEGLIAVQIFGEEPEIMAEAAEILEKRYKPDIIDINMGCPAPKIVKTGAGAALMKNPCLAGEIVLAVRNKVEIPVTVKMRKGWDSQQINAVELARITEKNGASAITVHGRTRSEFYSGSADREIIREVKQSVSITVIGNGDIFSPQDTERMIDQTGCDGVMIGRGARGNPWLLKRCIHYLKTGELIPEPDYCSRVEMALYHLKKAVQYYGEEIAIPKMRKHISWYIKGLPYSTDIKDKINRAKDFEQTRLILEEYLDSLVAGMD